MNYISWIIIGTALITIILVALQDRSSGVGGAFGSSDAGGFYQRRRGVERFLFGLTLVSIAIFMVASLVNLTSLVAKPAQTPISDIKVGDVQVETSNGSGENAGVTIEEVPAE